MSIVEAELSLMPSSAKLMQNGNFHPHVSSRAPQMADSGFADAPAEIRRLYISCMHLLHLVSDEESSQFDGASPGSPSSSEDSLNNPVELLRHAMKTDSNSNLEVATSRLAEIDECLRTIQRQVQQAIGAPLPVISGKRDAKNFATDIMRAKTLILSGVSQLEGLQSMDVLGMDMVGVIRLFNTCSIFIYLNKMLSVSFSHIVCDMPRLVISQFSVHSLLRNGLQMEPKPSLLLK